MLHTGDMVEAKVTPSPMFKGQQLSAEWQQYSDAVRAAGWWDATRWLDLRGNHDAIRVFSPTDPANLCVSVCC